MKYLPLLLFVIVFVLSCSERGGEHKKAENIYYDKAFDYREEGKADSAFVYFNKAREQFLLDKDSLGVGKCLVNMGLLATNKGDYFSGQEFSLNASSYFDHNNKDQYVYLFSNYNNLAIATEALGDNLNAGRFYDAAVRTAVDSVNKLVALNNKATSYRAIKNYPAAIKIYNKILKGTVQNRKEYARTLTNLTYTRWLQDSSYNALPNYRLALRIRQQEKDLWGLNSSYAHLAEFYTRNATDSAFLYAGKNYQVAREIESPDDQLTALQQLIRLAPLAETKKYFVAYQKLDDSLKKARGHSKNQFAIIRYETEKHKSDFLKSQGENIRKKNNILFQNFVLAILLLIILGAYFWYRKRKKILDQEKELEVKNTELKYVKRIHDRVANKVYHVMSEVENSPNMTRDLLLDKLEVLYNISRDISYESPEPATGDDYTAQLSAMLRSYSSDLTEVLIVANEPDLWEVVDEAAKAEVYLIMQELMTNMKKHSKAHTVVIKFQWTDTHVSILYTDDGVGMGDAAKKNGLKNTENRINGIRGTVTFDNILEKGLSIHISFPIS